MERKLTIFALIIILISDLLILNASLIKGTPARDSGIFLYIGDQILNGRLPYRDLWEHKPPLIFYINAFGLSLYPGPKLWGIWTLELINILISSTFSFLLLKKAFGFLPGLLGSLMWLLYFEKFLQGGNQIEEYGLALQFITLLLFYQAETVKRRVKYYFLVGIFGGLTFLLRQNLIEIPAAILVYLLLQKKLLGSIKFFALKTGYLLTGFSIIPFLAFLYFYVNNVSFDFYDQAFTYNFIYTDVTWEKKFLVVETFIQRYPSLTVVTISGFLLSLYVLLKGQKVSPAQSILSKLGVILLPITVYFITLSGRAYDHYYTPLLFLVSISSAQLIYFILRQLRTLLKLVPFGMLVVVTVFIFFNFGQIGFLIKRNLEEKVIGKNLQIRWFLFNNFEEHKEAIQFIKNNTDPDDYVLVWGAEASLNYVTQRSSPSRYFNQQSLFNSHYSSPAKFDEFIKDIKIKKPKLIIDTSLSTLEQGIDKLPLIPPLNPISERRAWMQKKGVFKEMDKIVDFIEENYDYVGKVRPKGWDLYREKR